MGIISSRVHGVLDYVVGLSLITVGWFLRTEVEPIGAWTPAVLGAFTILYSSFTNYEVARFRVLSMRLHLVLDFIAGLALAASPWLFGFSDQLYLPHLVVGLLEIGVVLLSDRTAFRSKKIEAENRSSFPAHAQ